MNKILSLAASLLYVSILSAQNVGIGTATPNASAKLDIVDANRGILLPRVQLTSTTVAAPVATPANWLVVFNTQTINDVSEGLYYWNGTRWVRITSTNDNWLLNGNSNGALQMIGTNDNFDFPIETNGVERMRITNGGNVGVGTNAPAERLHVVGNIRSSALAGTGNRLVASDANGTLANIAAGTNGQILTMVAGAPAWATATNNNWTLTGNAGTNPATNFLGTADNQALVVRTNNIERVRVAANGYVGVSTNAPTTSLQVNTGANTADNNMQAFSLNRASRTVENSLLWMTAGAIDWYLYQDNDNTSNLRLYSNGNTSWVQSWDYTTGNVGINTTAPAERLHVVGNIRSSALAGTGNRMVASDANGTLTNIAAGTNGQILTMVAGAPAWATAANNNWTLTGNAGTNPATNFVGTSDAQDFVTRTNNTERLRVTSTGNVGVGVTAPATLVSTKEGALRIGQGSPDYAELTGGTGFGANLSLRWATNGLINSFISGNNNSYLNTQVGNTGVGINNPTEKLHVGNGNARIGEINAAGSGAFPNAGRALFFSGGLSAGAFNSDNSDPLSIQRYNQANDQSDLQFIIGDNGVSPNNDRITIGDVNAQRIALSASGHVGINTLSPATNLHVVGSTRLEQNAAALQLVGVTGGHTYIEYYPQNLAAGRMAYLGFPTNGSNNFNIYNENPTGNINLSTQFNGGIPELTVNVNGNVGIGTVSPAAKLDIIGTMKLTDGTQGAYKQLTSDAAGNARWESAPSDVTAFDLSSQVVAGTATNLYSGNVNLSKGTYLVYFYNCIAAASTNYYITAGAEFVSGSGTTFQPFVWDFSQNRNYTTTPSVLKVQTATATVRGRVRHETGGTVTENPSSCSGFHFVRIGD